MKNKKALIIIGCLVVALLLLIIVDYINLPSKLGIMSENINFEALGIFANVFLAIIIFALTYHFINSWDVKRRENKIGIAQLLLKSAYENAEILAKTLNNKYILQNLVASKDEENTAGSQYDTLPFENERLVLDLALDGVVSKEQFKQYLDVKDAFAAYANFMINFSHDDVMEKLFEDNLHKTLSIARNNLNIK